MSEIVQEKNMPKPSYNSIMLLTVPYSGSTLLQALIGNFIGIPANWDDDFKMGRHPLRTDYLIFDNDTKISSIEKVHSLHWEELGDGLAKVSLPSYDSFIHIQRGIIDSLSSALVKHYHSIDEFSEWHNNKTTIRVLDGCLLNIMQNQYWTMNSPHDGIIIQYDDIVDKPKKVLEYINEFLGYEYNHGNMNLLKDKKNIDMVFENTRNGYGKPQQKYKFHEECKEQVKEFFSSHPSAKKIMDSCVATQQLDKDYIIC